MEGNVSSSDVSNCLCVILHRTLKSAVPARNDSSPHEPFRSSNSPRRNERYREGSASVGTNLHSLGYACATWYPIGLLQCLGRTGFAAFQNTSLVPTRIQAQWTLGGGAALQIADMPVLYRKTRLPSPELTPRRGAAGLKNHAVSGLRERGGCMLYRCPPITYGTVYSMNVKNSPQPSGKLSDVGSQVQI